MELPDNLLAALAALGDAIDDDGTDLTAILAVLRDDLLSAVPSYLGLRLTLSANGNSTILTVPEPAGVAPRVGASLRFPLAALTDAVITGHVAFYATTPHAFDDLAADTRRLLGLDGQVQIDQHLDGLHQQDSDSDRRLEQRSEIDQAIGVLIDQGHTSHQASEELTRRALADGHNLHRSAQRILDDISPTSSP